nr:MAG TPA: hypothetical protein [Caudoviricetes sp.]
MNISHTIVWLFYFSRTPRTALLIARLTKENK